jgi:hypothetical protein
MAQRSIKTLAEELKNLSKYLDRDIVDYWRTIQGTPVGFHGDPKSGAGIPIAGPPVLTGGSASGNVLLEPLLKKYQKDTFIGDAIRKPNFPLSAIMFIENFVGKDNDEIEARIAKMDKALDEGLENEIQSQIERYYPYDTSHSAMADLFKPERDKIIYFNKENSRFELTKESEKLRHAELDRASKFVDVLNDNVDDREKLVALLASKTMKIGKRHLQWVSDKNEPHHDVSISEIASEIYQSFNFNSKEHKKYISAYTNKKDSLPEGARNKLHAYDLLMTHFHSTGGKSLKISELMRAEGVAGTFSSSDNFGSNTDGKGIPSGLYQKVLAIAFSEPDYNLTPVKLDYDAYAEIKSQVGDMYAMNQAVLRRRGIDKEAITRSMGGKIGGIEGSRTDTLKILEEIESKGVSFRFKNRPLSGFANGKSTFLSGWAIRTEVPVEATLSSFEGLQIQDSRFAGERETLVIGASSLPFKPDEIGWNTNAKWTGTTHIREFTPIAKIKDNMDILNQHAY